MSEQEIKRKANGCTFVLVLIVVVGIAFGVNSCSKIGSTPAAKPTNLAYDEMTDDMKLHVMSYAHTVIDDKLHSPEYSRSIRDYNFVRTDDRYKISGKVSGINFWMIIRWDYIKDDYFDVELFEVGTEKII